MTTKPSTSMHCKLVVEFCDICFNKAENQIPTSIFFWTKKRFKKGAESNIETIK